MYTSLCEQVDKDFTWIIINDGSKKETEDVLIDIGCSDVIDVFAINQANGGKGSAINNGLDSLDENVEFVVIIDDDEHLKPDAIQTIKKYIEKYRNTECGVIHFNRQNEKGEVIAKPTIYED